MLAFKSPINKKLSIPLVIFCCGDLKMNKIRIIYIYAGKSVPSLASAALQKCHGKVDFLHTAIKESS
jgi:hypothetical protein